MNAGELRQLAPRRIASVNHDAGLLANAADDLPNTFGVVALVTWHPASVVLQAPRTDTYPVRSTGTPFNGDGERYNIVLDDLQGDLAKQLVAELRRVSAAYAEIAAEVEAG